MRENNHIINRNSYQDVSSYKIREPVENTFYPNRGKQQQNHSSHENNTKSSKVSYPSKPQGGYYINPPKKPTPVYQERSQNQSREQSKGSNMSRNSIKMSDLVAFQARNILQNKEKFKYEQSNHARRSSMQYYPKTEMKMINNKNQLSSVERNGQQQQPCEIPSFGVECRSTMSAYDKPPLPHSISSHYNPSTCQSHLKELTPFQLRNQRLKSEIDERIQRLKVSSNSTNHHKQRLSSIKVLDANRIQSMDKINIKIKSILKTLQSEEDHYNKKKITTEGNDYLIAESNVGTTSKRRLKTVDGKCDRYEGHVTSSGGGCALGGQYRQSSFKKDNKPYHHSQIADNKKFYPECRQLFSNPSSLQLIKEVSRTQMKCNQNNGMMLRNHSYHQQPYYHQSQQQEYLYKRNDGHDGINVQSYYYYGDQEAMLKSEESSPEKSFNKKFSVGKYEGDKMEEKSIQKKYSTKDVIGSYKLTCPSQLQSKLSSQKPLSKQPSSLSPSSKQQQLDYLYKPDNNSLLNNIPQCQTQIVDSKTFQNLNNCYVFQYQQNQSYNIKAANGGISVLDGMDGCIKLTETIAMESKRKHNSVYLKTKTDQQKVTTNLYDNQKEFKKIDNKSSHQQQLLSQQYSLTPTLNQQPTLPIKPTQPNYFYPDSIKQTPRNSQPSERPYQQNNCTRSQQKPPNQNRSQSCSQQQQNDQLQNKLKSYQKRIQNYNREMSASKLLEAHRSNSYKNIQKSLSNRSLLNQNDKPISNNGVSAVSQRIFEDVKKQRTNKVNEAKPPKQQIHKEWEGKNGLQNKQQNKQKKPKSPRPSHRFAKQDHQKLIDSLRKEREEVSALSKRKSVDLPRLSPSPLQRSNQRSQSDNSRLSSVTIVKGKNVDEQIQKLQKKMQHNRQLRKQLQQQPKKNINRSASHNRISPGPIEKRQQPMSLQKMYELRQKSPKIEKRVRFDQNSLSKRQVKKRDSKEPSLSSNARCYTQPQRDELMKIVAEENSYVKVKNSIIKQHKTTQLKNYLNEELQKQSNLPHNKEKTQSLILQKKNSQSQLKENIIPTTSNSARSNVSQDYAKPPLGQKKVVFGLATNLVNYQHQHEKSQLRVSGETEDNDVGTPKLLRNLKHKAPEKSIVKKRAQKRGFRSQFINDLHQENEVLYSAKKNSQQLEDAFQQTPRLRPQLRETLDLILSKLEEQILRDEKFRNEKKLFNALTGKDKWSELMSEYVRVTGDRTVTLSEIMDVFTLTDDESNPFYSTRGNQLTLLSLVQCHLACEQNWSSLVSYISPLSFSILQQCGLNLRNLDIQKKGYIDIQDLIRFLNMEMNKYYRKRDLYLLWRRIQGRVQMMYEVGGERKGQSLSIQQLLCGLGAGKAVVV